MMTFDECRKEIAVWDEVHNHFMEELKKAFIKCTGKDGFVGTKCLTVGAATVGRIAASYIFLTANKAKPVEKVKELKELVLAGLEVWLDSYMKGDEE